ncbi:ABC transporter substrate-binding protein [Actinophytocola oryzae]|uniref:Carbohydrate ABC transporter substrate-binding protein (CUT1 family) n=1 Tax=Actinophytocola oryzae TaxID=502181 RepID=A0A4R7UY04_9PSEU|nr:extracellular solute-binding protein [Actinophytocola oryzae]TDV41768.1 carbohydrate ABC transporter substrate-binding protein (CUT1 family) [Actinophytocola oryzae]
MRREVHRRTLLRTAALAPLAGLVGGCGELAAVAGLGDDVRVAVSWSAAELAAFAHVLDGRGVRDYELIPLGDDIGAALNARTAGRPDVVAVPQVGHVTANLDHVAPLPDGVWHDEYERIWPAASADGRHYALPFKLANVSVVWYRADLGITPPTTWEDWLELNEELIDRGVTPLALGGADGWVLAQFFENVLLRTYPETFDELAARRDPKLWDGTEVFEAFEMVATMWGRPAVLSGGAGNSLVRQFPDAVLEMCRYGRAAMVPAPDFAESVIRRFAPDPDAFDTFTFPPGNGGDPPLAVSSDLLVLTRPASGPAQDLIRYLATPDAPVPWIRETGGFIAANPHTSFRYYSPTLERLATELREHDIRFGLADQLGRLGGSEGLQRVLQNLLRGTAAGTTPSVSARAACRAMVDAARRTGS